MQLGIFCRKNLGVYLVSRCFVGVVAISFPTCTGFCSDGDAGVIILLSVEVE
jgi:hypothetical protein